MRIPVSPDTLNIYSYTKHVNKDLEFKPRNIEDYERIYAKTLDKHDEVSSLVTNSKLQPILKALGYSDLAAS